MTAREVYRDYLILPIDNQLLEDGELTQVQLPSGRIVGVEKRKIRIKRTEEEQAEAQREYRRRHQQKEETKEANLKNKDDPERKRVRKEYSEREDVKKRKKYLGKINRLGRGYVKKKYPRIWEEALGDVAPDFVLEQKLLKAVRQEESKKRKAEREEKNRLKKIEDALKGIEDTSICTTGAEEEERPRKRRKKTPARRSSQNHDVNEQ